ncbi:MAG: ABC transporter ATP-binding protein [Chloroflexota bacterium]|nr:ABC transporter ATP-binding protein [Chloroflexota bacterium]
MDQAAIHATGLHKSFGDTHAVRGVDLSVPRGEVFGFLGPNGAGKSTVVKIILGLVQATAGDVTVLGHPAGSLAARRRIGFLPETFRFHEWMHASEFLDFHGRLAGLDRDTRSRRVPEMLELVGLAQRRRDRLATFSKGMLQRIGLAQALLAEPPLVVLDEPTSALDPIGRRDVRDIIRALRAGGTTVFLNSHLLSEIEQVCDQVAIINRGQVVAAGDLRQLLAAREVELRLGDGADAALRAAGLEPLSARPDEGRYTLTAGSDEEIARITANLAGAGVSIYEVQVRSNSLEDLFVRLADSTDQ